MSSSDENEEECKRRRRERIEAAPYPVGFGKTPEDTRFKPGNQAAKRRRLKTTKTAADIFERLGRERIKVNRNGKPTVITCDEAIAYNARQNALKGKKNDIAFWYETRNQAACLSTYREADPIDYGKQVRDKIEQMHQRMLESRKNGMPEK